MSKVSTVEHEWHRADSEYSILLYTLKPHGWRKGEPMMVNDLMVRIENASGSQNDLAPIAETILSALASRHQEPGVEPFMWVVQWEWKKDPGQEVAGGGTSYPTNEAAADAEVARLETAPQLAWAKKVPLYAAPQPAPVVTDEMVEKFRAELEELVDVHLTGQLVKRCLTAALQKQEGGE